MKRVTTIILLIVRATVANAQTSVSKIQTSASSSEMVVKDSAGRLYSTEEWRRLTATGEYGLKAKEYVLYKLSDEHKAQIAKRMPTLSANFQIGTSMNFFTAKDIYGNVYQRDNLEGKVIVLHFWQVNPAINALNQARIPQYSKLAKDFSANPNVMFLAITSAGRQAIRDFVKTTPFDYHLIEEATDIIKTFGLYQYPTDVVINKKGIITHSRMGFSANNVAYLRKMIDESLKSQ